MKYSPVCQCIKIFPSIGRVVVVLQNDKPTRCLIVIWMNRVIKTDSPKRISKRSITNLSNVFQVFTFFSSINFSRELAAVFKNTISWQQREVGLIAPCVVLFTTACPLTRSDIIHHSLMDDDPPNTSISEQRHCESNSAAEIVQLRRESEIVKDVVYLRFY